MQNNFENNDSNIDSAQDVPMDIVNAEEIEHIEGQDSLQEESISAQEREGRPQNSKKSKLNGFSVLEGVTICGEHYYATAVRDPEYRIQIENRRIKPNRFIEFFRYFILLRGIIYFFANLFVVSKHLYRSTEMSIDDSNSGKFNKWMEDKLKINISSTLLFLFLIFLITLAIVVFACVQIILVAKIV